MDAQGARPEQLAKLEAKWQEREADKLRRRELAAEVSDPAESAHVFWQVSPNPGAWVRVCVRPTARRRGSGLRRRGMRACA